MLEDNTLDEFMLEEPETVKPGSIFVWYFRAKDEFGNSYRIGTLEAQTMGEATRLAAKTWPEEGAYLDFCHLKDWPLVNDGTL